MRFVMYPSNNYDETPIAINSLDTMSPFAQNEYHFMCLSEYEPAVALANYALCHFFDIAKTCFLGGFVHVWNVVPFFIRLSTCTNLLNTAKPD